MSIKKITLDNWASELSKYRPNSNNYKKLMGYSPGGAAAALNVSRQFTWKLVKEGKLDQLYCTDKTGKTVAILITDYSIEKYKRERHNFQQFRKVQQVLDLNSD